MVNPGHDEDKVRAENADSEGAQSVNSFGNRLWCVSLSMFLSFVMEVRVPL
jgi:hypothetical protein